MHSIAALKIYGKFLLGRKFLGDFSEIFRWAIPLEMRYFRAKSQVRVSRYRDFTKLTSAIISKAFQKKSKSEVHPRQKFA